MKFNKIMSLCKKNSHFTLFETDDTQWLSDGFAAYPLYGHPKYDEDSLATISSLSQKQIDKCFFVTEQFPKEFNIDDCVELEQVVEEYRFCILFDSEMLIPVSTSLGLRFINKKYISPIGEDDYQIYERATSEGKIYFVIKTGFAIKGIVLSSDFVLSEDKAEQFKKFSAEMSCAVELIKANKEIKEEA